MAVLFRFLCRTCPFCGRDDFKPSRYRLWIERMFCVVIPIQPVRCMDCMRRYYVVRQLP